MRITGARNTISHNQIVRVLKKHVTKDHLEAATLATKILKSPVIDLEDDWALEQDLKDLGFRVD